MAGDKYTAAVSWAYSTHCGVPLGANTLKLFSKKEPGRALGALRAPQCSLALSQQSWAESFDKRILLLPTPQTRLSELDRKSLWIPRAWLEGSP